MPNYLKIDSVNPDVLAVDSSDGLLLIEALVEMTQLSSIQLSCKLVATLENLLDGDTVTASVQQGFDAVSGDTALSSGTSDNQADWIWSDTDRSLTSGNSESIDLYDLASIDIGAGAGKDALGQSVTLAEVVGILIHVAESSAGELLVGGEGTAAAFNSPFNGSDSAVLGPFGAGGKCLLLNPVDPGWVVADSTNHLLQLEASGGDVTYSIAILGRSA